MTRTGGQVFLYLYNPNIIQRGNSLTKEWVLKDHKFVENEPPERSRRPTLPALPVVGNAQTTLYHAPQTAAEVQLNADLNLDITQTNANYSRVDIMLEIQDYLRLHFFSL